MNLVVAVEKADALTSRAAPVVEEPLHQVGVVEHDVVNVAVQLTVQGHRVGLALGADAPRPRRVVFASGLDAAAHVLQGYELAPRRDTTHIRSR